MTGSEIVEFSTAVRTVFAVLELKRLLLSLNREFDDYVPTGAATYPEQVDQLVARANSGGWIQQLVAAVIRERSGTGAIQAFLARHPTFDVATNPPLAHPCDTLFVFGGKCFIGRKVLRDYLKTMDLLTGKKVLLVLSDHRKVGKTYSTGLVNFLAANQQGAEMIPLDLDQGEYDPGSLASEIGRFMGLANANVPRQDQQQAPRWNQELVRWLIPTPPRPGDSVWWIVLDGFRQKVPSEATQDFIAQLALRVQETPRFRLILINYTYPLPLEVAGFALTERVSPLEESEVEAFLSRVHVLRHGAEPSRQRLTAYVTGVNALRAQFAKEHPEAAENQLLLNIAVSKAAEIIQA